MLAKYFTEHREMMARIKMSAILEKQLLWSELFSICVSMCYDVRVRASVFLTIAIPMT